MNFKKELDKEKQINSIFITVKYNNTNTMLIIIRLKMTQYKHIWKYKEVNEAFPSSSSQVHQPSTHIGQVILSKKVMVYKDVYRGELYFANQIQCESKVGN
jgi:hypothetical protein